MLPFVVLLAGIALGPIILRYHWERHYHKVCLGLAAIVCAYYVFVLKASERVAHAGSEYFSFMAVVGSFFVVAGGIHVRPKSRARPLTNVVFLFLGALLANVIGTIGASMLLIRPWLEMNKTRFAGFHLAFFIFIVSNVGGALLPVGPPLFLGIFERCALRVAVVALLAALGGDTALLLLVFYLIDVRGAKGVIEEKETGAQEWRLFGKRNFLYLVTLLLALVFLPDFWRGGVMIACAACSYFFTPAHIHRANAFAFGPIKEIAWLFLGIFGTMIPVLDYVQSHARDLGLQHDAQFFWATGLLSALLDNAPTYLTFFAGALGLHGFEMRKASDILDFIQHHGHYLVAVSTAATFFGALTYIGNGPNLLVKAIAERADVPTPNFFTYTIKYPLPVLLPIFVLITFLFFWR